MCQAQYQALHSVLPVLHSPSPELLEYLGVTLDSFMSWHIPSAPTNPAGPAAPRPGDLPARCVQAALRPHPRCPCSHQSSQQQLEPRCQAELGVCRCWISLSGAVSQLYLLTLFFEVLRFIPSPFCTFRLLRRQWRSSEDEEASRAMNPCFPTPRPLGDLSRQGSRSERDPPPALCQPTDSLCKEKTAV